MNINTKDMPGIGNEATYSVKAYGGVWGKISEPDVYTPFGYSTDTVLATALNYNGVTYNSGTVVHSDLSYSMFDLKYQRDLINRENILAGFLWEALFRSSILRGV